MMDDYIEAQTADKDAAVAYFEWSLSRGKPEQQKRLEALLASLPAEPVTVADIACGGGDAVRYLGELYPRSRYTLVDRFEPAVAFARESTRHLTAACLLGDFYNLPLKTSSQDVVICWQTLSWVRKPDVALRELIRVCKPGGRVFASSLFNAEVDVDVYSTVVDHTRLSAREGHGVFYNTYSFHSLRRWVDRLVADFQVHPFEMSIDLEYRGRGLGTRTVRLEDGTRLQISGGMLLNWGILELRK